MISLMRCSNYNGKNTCKENGTCDGKCSWMEEQIRLENTPKAGETVILPTKKLETMMFKVFNILLALEEADSGEIDINQLKGIQKVLGYQITSDELYNFFKEFGIDIE